MFNGRHNTSSAVFSECSTFKTNFSPDPAVASVYTTVTTVVEDKATNLFIEKPPNESRPNKRIFEVVVTGASLFIAVFIVLVFVKQKKGQVSEPKASEKATEHTTTNGVATSANVSNHAQEGADSPLRSIQKWSSAMSIESDHFCKEIWQELCNYVIGQERFPSEKFVNRIDNTYFDLDSLKEIKISEDDNYFSHVSKSDKLEGVLAFKKPGENSPCLYTWISHLLCRDDQWKSIIRLAAARFALQNYDTYIEWLTNVFLTAKSLNDAHFFFKIHGVEFKVNDSSAIKIGVQLAFADLVKEIFNAGSGNGPFYVKFLSGALNCNIIQHYENDSFAGRKVERTQCLLIPFPKIDCSDRELHIFWMKSINDMNNYHVLHLVKSQEGH
ncbi:hypothetical protein DPMN_166162 [Dreissena polymorpha]|uniref:Uncharacterized protein n=1 Tax=Dreissena polymorpha TaxID=45954 RepID=A0A9D4EY64_DREPO|nr:hypothetical protein DPMN_166162 [Dreissena polymorpha]